MASTRKQWADQMIACPSLCLSTDSRMWAGRFSLWTAPAERSGDGAFERAGRPRIREGSRACESGVALRLPPQSKWVRLRRVQSRRARGWDSFEVVNHEAVQELPQFAHLRFA